MKRLILLTFACFIGLSAGTPVIGGGSMARGIPGGWFPLNPASPKAWQLAWFIAGELCPQCAAVGIMSAQQQVVAGMNYRLVVRINKISPSGLPYEFLKCTAQIYQNLSGHKVITEGIDCVFVPILVTRGGPPGKFGKKPF